MILEARQYMRPDGRVRTIQTVIPDAYSEHVDSLKEHECRLATEMLRTGEVSLTIEDEEQDYDCEVVVNGPAVPLAIFCLLERRSWERRTS